MWLAETRDLGDETLSLVRHGYAILFVYRSGACMSGNIPLGVGEGKLINHVQT